MSSTDLGFRRYQASETEQYIYECGHEMGSCTCYDCAVPDCDNYKDKETDTYCSEHAEGSPMRCRSCGFYPCTCGADERS